jgi:hypothetical protein
MIVESTLTNPCQDWLARRGLVPVLEAMLPCIYLDGTEQKRAVDCVGWSATRIVVIEMKSSLSSDAIEQAASTKHAAHESWVATARASESKQEEARLMGVGVLAPDKDWRLQIVTEPGINLCETQHTHAWRDLLGRAPDRSIAGEPMRAGEGSLQRERASIVDFFRQHPESSWRLAYKTLRHTAGSWTELRAKHSKQVCAALGLVKIR